MALFRLQEAKTTVLRLAGDLKKSQQSPPVWTTVKSGFYLNLFWQMLAFNKGIYISILGEERSRCEQVGFCCQCQCNNL